MLFWICCKSFCPTTKIKEESFLRIRLSVAIIILTIEGKNCSTNRLNRCWILSYNSLSFDWDIDLRLSISKFNQSDEISWSVVFSEVWNGTSQMTNDHWSLAASYLSISRTISFSRLTHEMLWNRSGIKKKKLTECDQTDWNSGTRYIHTVIVDHETQ